MVTQHITKDTTCSFQTARSPSVSQCCRGKRVCEREQNSQRKRARDANGNLRARAFGIYIFFEEKAPVKI